MNTYTKRGDSLRGVAYVRIFWLQGSVLTYEVDRNLMMTLSVTQIV
jgi:outer membrane receptor for monomeric catechols